jgi:Transcription factor WhiB
MSGLWCDNPAVPVGELLDDLSHAPSLRGALCRGHPELFDAVNRHDPRIAAARAICASCPVLAECHAWLVSLPAGLRPSGVVAGVYVAPPWSPAPAGYSPRVCAECGRHFAARRSSAQYCSTLCRMYASRARRGLPVNRSG